MGKAKQQLNSGDFGSIPRFREIIKTLPKEIRICPRHGGELDIKLGEPLLQSGRWGRLYRSVLGRLL